MAVHGIALRTEALLDIVWWSNTLRRDTVKEASTAGIGCVGWIPMVRGCAANPPCYNAVVGSLVSMERLHIDSGGAG